MEPCSARDGSSAERLDTQVVSIETFFVKKSDCQCAPPSIYKVDRNRSDDIVNLESFQGDGCHRGEEARHHANHQA